MAPSVQSVTTEEEYIHVRFRDPDDFDEIRTPEWATRAAQSVSEGARVRTGRRSGSDEWVVQSVLLAKTLGEEKAVEQAKRVVDEIES